MINELPAGVDPRAWSDTELVAVASAVAAEQYARALESADIDALIRQGFEDGFKSDGLPRDPWLVSNLLVCPGARVDKSATSHECGFVTVGSKWVWECDEKITDEVRHMPAAKPVMRSVTVCAVYEGLEVDLVVSRMRTGVHQMRQVRSFAVTDGKLELVSTRARQADYRNERR